MSGNPYPRLHIENSIVLHAIYRQRTLPHILNLIYHRISFAKDGPSAHYPDLEAIPDDDLRGHDIHERFQDTRPNRAGSYTGGLTPYTFLLTKDWTFQQLAEVSDVTPHARRWNTTGVSTAVVGDFRTQKVDWATFEYLTAWTALWMAFGCTVHGHTDMHHASRNRGKICPGPGLKLDLIRDKAAAHPWAHNSKKWATGYLSDLGVVF